MSHAIFDRVSVEAGVKLPNALLFKGDKEGEEEGSSGLRIPLVIYRTSGAYVDCLIFYLGIYVSPLCLHANSEAESTLRQPWKHNP